MAYTNFTNCTKEQYESIIYSEEDTNRIRIWFNNVELIDADEYCESFSGTNRILPDDGNKIFTLDNFVAKNYTLILRDLPEGTIISDQVKVSIGTLVNENNSTYEDVPIGIFNIQDTPINDRGRVTIKLRDNRVKFDFNYNAQPLIESLGGTATKKQILEDICNQAGVTNNVSTFDGEDDEIGIYDNTITATTYVSYIFEQAGLMPFINREGQLDKINFNDLKVWRIPLSIVEKYEKGTPFKIERVVYESGIIKYESSNDESLDTLYLNSANPYINDKQQIDNIYNLLVGFSADSVKSGRILGNPAIDPFDMILIYDDEINDNPITNTTGTNITLENTPNAPMKIDLLGNTTQDTTTGKNLIGLTNGTYSSNGINAIVNNGIITLTGTSTAVSLIDIPLLQTISSSLGTLTKSLNPSGTYTSVQTSVRKQDTSSAGLWSNDGANRTETLSGNAYYFRIQVNSGISVNCKLYPQIETGSTVTTYEIFSYGASPNPQFPQPIETVTGNTEIKTIGKNLLNVTATNSTNNGITMVVNEDGSCTLNGTNTGSTSWFRLCPNFTLEAGTYTLSNGDDSRITYNTALFMDDDHNFGYVTSTKTFTNTITIKPYIRVQANAVLDNLTIKPMIEKSDEATSYEPYKENSYEINLGKNLLPEYSTGSFTTNGVVITTNNDGSITLNGSNTTNNFVFVYLNNGYWSTNSYNSNGKLVAKANTYYTLKGTNLDNVCFRIRNMDNSTNSTPTKNDYTFSFNSDTNINAILYLYPNTTYDNVNIYPQLEKGTKSTSYASHFTPIELCKIGNYQDRLFKSSGKNLFNGEYLNAIVGTDGKYSDNNTTRTAEIKVEPNTTYSLKKFANTGIGTRLIIVESSTKLSNNQSGTFIYNSNSATEYSYTTGSTANYMYIYVTNDTTSIPYLMVVKGGTIPTEYEPYGSNEWYIKKNIGKVVLDGSETWYSNQEQTLTRRFHSPIFANKLPAVSNIGYSNYFILSTSGDVDRASIYVGDRYIYIFIQKSIANSIDDFKTWLSTNNTTVYYVLATPTYTKIDNDELIGQLNRLKTIQTIEGTTNIQQNNSSLPFELNVEYFNESYILKTLANNTYKYTGINRNEFNTEISLEQRTENVSISSEATLKKWAKTNIDNLQGQITLSAGDINDLEGRVNQTELDISSQSAKIEVLSTNIDEETGNVLGVKTTSYELGSNGFIIDDGTGYKSIDNTTGKYFYDNNSMVGKYTKDGSVQKNLALFGKYYYGVDENVNVETFSKEEAMFVAQEYTGQNEQGNDETGFGHFYNGD